MSASLVGSEMCIRDRSGDLLLKVPGKAVGEATVKFCFGPSLGDDVWPERCLLYTSDAADDM
eukprot:3681851-Alexandrium_andersonii.AAC.1